MSNPVTTVGPERSWRLVYANGAVLDLFESAGYTTTMQNIFTGDFAACQAEIIAKSLTPLPVIEE